MSTQLRKTDVAYIAGLWREQPGERENLKSPRMSPKKAEQPVVGRLPECRFFDSSETHGPDETFIRVYK